MCEICLLREFMRNIASGKLTDPEREEWHNEIAREFAHSRGLTLLEAAMALSDGSREAH
jgi:hypothetical protein